VTDRNSFQKRVHQSTRPGACSTASRNRRISGLAICKEIALA